MVFSASFDENGLKQEKNVTAGEFDMSSRCDLLPNVDIVYLSVLHGTALS